MSNPNLLLDQLRFAVRRRNYAYRTEQCYAMWVRRYILFHGALHPSKLSEPDVAAFLSHLARDKNVSRNTQNQARDALAFLYEHVLGKPLGLLPAIEAASFKVPLPIQYRFVAAAGHKPGLFMKMPFLACPLHIKRFALSRKYDLYYASSRKTLYAQGPSREIDIS